MDTILGLIKTLDFNTKVMSNKLNEIMDKLKEQREAPPKIIVETVQTAPKPAMPPAFTQLPAGDPERNIPISADDALPQTNAPQGFRRTSRPETYANKPEIKMPIQMPPGMQMPIVPPGRSVSDVLVPDKTPTREPKKAEPITMIEQPEPISSQGQIPVVQRCVDKNNKSIFLAEVEVLDLETKQVVLKTRSNAAGKWQGVFAIGSYRAIIRKRESLTKEKIEAVHDFKVDGTSNKLELPILIIK